MIEKEKKEYPIKKQNLILNKPRNLILIFRALSIHIEKKNHFPQSKFMFKE